jgi:hypothetical protein
MEAAVFLLEQGFSVVLEPTYPEKARIFAPTGKKHRTLSR